MDNIKINYFMMGEAALIDKETGNLSIINIFENINSTVFPAKHPKFTVVANFTAARPENLRCHIDLDIPGSGRVKGQDFSFNTESDNQKIQIINNFVDVVFAEEGMGKVILAVNDKDVSSIDLNIKKI